MTLGNFALDAGYFYAPYMPLLRAPVIQPQSFQVNRTEDGFVVQRYAYEQESVLAANWASVSFDAVGDDDVPNDSGDDDLKVNWKQEGF